MKKKIIYFPLLFLIATSSWSQEKALSTDNFGDNCSAGVIIGSYVPMIHSAIFKNIRPSIGIEGSKQISPKFALGIEGSTIINEGGENTFDILNMLCTGRLNLTNFFSPYEGIPKKRELELVVGIGCWHTFLPGENDYNQGILKFGTNINFNIDKERMFTISVRPSVMYLFDAETKYSANSLNINYAFLNCDIGLIYHFRGSNWKHYYTLKTVRDQSEIDSLNAKINDLRELLAKSRSDHSKAMLKIKRLQHQINK